MPDIYNLIPFTNNANYIRYDMRFFNSNISESYNTQDIYAIVPISTVFFGPYIELFCFETY